MSQIHVHVLKFKWLLFRISDFIPGDTGVILDADWCTEVHVDIISNDFMRTLLFQKAKKIWLKLKETQKQDIKLLELPNVMVRNFILGNFIRRMIKLQNWSWQETKFLILTATITHSLGIISDMNYMNEKLSKDSVKASFKNNKLSWISKQLPRVKLFKQTVELFISIIISFLLKNNIREFDLHMIW